MRRQRFLESSSTSRIMMRRSEDNVLVESLLVLPISVSSIEAPYRREESCIIASIISMTAGCCHYLQWNSKLPPGQSGDFCFPFLNLIPRKETNCIAESAGILAMTRIPCSNRWHTIIIPRLQVPHLIPTNVITFCEPRDDQRHGKQLH